MANLDPSVVTGIVTFAMSVGASSFISGMRWGQMTTAMNSVDARLAKIEGMFVMVPVQMPGHVQEQPHHNP